LNTALAEGHVPGAIDSPVSRMLRDCYQIFAQSIGDHTPTIQRNNALNRLKHDSAV
jgi:hypothetical protein